MDFLRHLIVFLPEIGLSGESRSLNPDRFDSRKVMSWIMCPSSVYIHASFPRSPKWHLQSAVALESTGMLNIQLSDWQKLLPHHPGVTEGSTTTHAHTSATAGRKNHHGVGHR